MPNNPEVAAALAPEKDWRTAYPFVEDAARKVLDSLSEGITVSTTELSSMIYDPNLAHDVKVRKRVFQALKACSTRGLQRYCTHGEPETIAGVANARRLHWHRGTMQISVPAQCCPTCKRPL